MKKPTISLDNFNIRTIPYGKSRYKKMHRLQYFKSDFQVKEVADEKNETIFGIEKSKGHQNRRKTQKSK